ncbi:hypothetical protein [Niveibacterium sp.]|uniref:hypothetical protein n=1 Tax=Niveibacterium sp. TaxID=2017444 RepID=UPI0035AEF59A
MKKFVVTFSGAGKKGMPFRGWAGPIIAWDASSPPKVGFGAWSADPGSLRGGGVVVAETEPFALVMWGANAPGMRPQDKTTKFGFAGLDDDGTLRPAPLPDDADARQWWREPPGWPDVADFAAQIRGIDIDTLRPISGLLEALALSRLAFAALGLPRIPIPADGDHPQIVAKLEHRLELISTSWPELTDLCAAIRSKLEEWKVARSIAKAQRFAIG